MFWGFLVWCIIRGFRYFLSFYLKKGFEMELLPLKITAGWEIVKNHFYDVDYNCCLSKLGTLSYPFYEDILIVRNKNLRLSIDLGWIPDGDPNGCYRLKLLSWEDDPKFKSPPKGRIFKNIDGVNIEYKLTYPILENWDAPLECYESKSRFDIQNKINDYLNWRR
jgi:hypothetical protein